MAKKDIAVYEEPSLHHPKMAAAFAGWADATHAGTSALSYLAKKLKAKEFANINAEEFYDFPANRPIVTISQGVIQQVLMPTSTFYYAKRQGHDLIFFLGDEPNLKWNRYVDSVLKFVNYWEIDRIYLLGGLYDTVTHTRETKITGATSQPHLTQVLKEHNIETLDYQGPSSIYSLILAVCKEKGMEAISLWGHVPFYIRAESNPLTCLALLNKLIGLLEIKLELADMEAMAKRFSSKLDQLLTQSPKLALYIRKLEKQYEDKGKASFKDLESADKILQEVEDFLKKERRDEGRPF